MKFTVTALTKFVFINTLRLSLNKASTCEASLIPFTNGTAGSQTFHFVFTLTKNMIFKDRKTVVVILDFSTDVLKAPRSSVGLLVRVTSMNVQT